MIVEKSHLYEHGVVLRDPLSLRTVASPNSRRAAVRFCEQRGYSMMAPVANVNQADLEEKI